MEKNFWNLEMSIQIGDNVIVGVPDTYMINRSKDNNLTEMNLRLSFYNGSVVGVSSDYDRCTVGVNQNLEILTESRFVYKPT